MDGLHMHPIVAAGAALAPVIWMTRHYKAPLYKQAEIAFIVVVAMLWIGATVGLFDQAPSDTRSDSGAFLRTHPFQPQSSRSAAANAAPESKTFAGILRSNPLLGFDDLTAVYDISAHTVYLPDGAQLEAHSGLGAMLDDPRYVHERMRGATPPHLYELSLRERRFHGVQALRLKPIGEGDLYGRAGLLAHSYMLGPNGDSNGCVVFKDYDAFLQAFQKGGVKRLFVVDHIEGAFLAQARDARPFMRCEASECLVTGPRNLGIAGEISGDAQRPFRPASRAGFSRKGRKASAQRFRGDPLPPAG
jgi:hypothetical protein